MGASSEGEALTGHLPVEGSGAWVNPDTPSPEGS